MDSTSWLKTKPDHEQSGLGLVYAGSMSWYPHYPVEDIVDASINPC